MQINPMCEELGYTSSAINLLNVNDTYTAPTNGVFSGYIRCAVGQSVGYIQIGSSLSQIGAIKAVQYVNGSGGYTMITLPMQKGETITIIAKKDLDGGLYGWFTSFSN